jgi:hypothetical protein
VLVRRQSSTPPHGASWAGPWQMLVMFPRAALVDMLRLVVACEFKAAS